MKQIKHLLRNEFGDPVIRDEWLFTAGMVVSIFLVTFAVMHRWPGQLFIVALMPAGATGIWLLSGDE